MDIEPRFETIDTCKPPVVGVVVVLKGCDGPCKQGRKPCQMPHSSSAT